MKIEVRGDPADVAKHLADGAEKVLGALRVGQLGPGVYDRPSTVDIETAAMTVAALGSRAEVPLVEVVVTIACAINRARQEQDTGDGHRLPTQSERAEVQNEEQV